MAHKSHLSLNRSNVFLTYKAEKNCFVFLEPEAGVDTYLTVRDVAVLLKLSVPTIRRYTMNKGIPFHKVDRAVRYKKSEVELWFEKREAAKAQARSEKQVSGSFTETETGSETV